MVAAHRRTGALFIVRRVTVIEDAHTRCAITPLRVSMMLCVPLTVLLCVRGGCAGGILHDDVRLLLTAAAVVGVHVYHAQRPRAAERAGAARSRLGIGRHRHAVGGLLDGGQIDAVASLSGGYGVSAGGFGRNDALASRKMQDVALCRPGGRWDVAVDMG